jgi:hypothetical protein
MILIFLIWTSFHHVFPDIVSVPQGIPRDAFKAHDTFGVEFDTVCIESAPDAFVKRRGLIVLSRLPSAASTSALVIPFRAFAISTFGSTRTG